MRLLITRPRYEETTHYLYHWAGELVAEATRRHVELIDLQKEKATRQQLESYLRKKSPDIVILNGHGNDSSVAGENGECLIKAGENTSLLKDKKVYVRACRAGRRLGPDVIKAGADGFVGYSQDFIFPYDKDNFQRPLERDQLVEFRDYEEVLIRKS